MKTISILSFLFFNWSGKNVDKDRLNLFANNIWLTILRPLQKNRRTLLSPVASPLVELSGISHISGHIPTALLQF